MSYLTADDLKAFLDEREIATIKRDYEADGLDKMPVGIAYAENYVQDRLANRYDMQAEYAKTGTDRNSTLLEILAHIAIWKLTSTFPTVQLDGKRHYFYEEALKNLTLAEKGNLLTSLPIKYNDGKAVIWGYVQGSETIY
jgi:hypothetical protein